MRTAAPALENNLDWDHRPDSNKEQLRSLVGYKAVLRLSLRECHWREGTPASDHCRTAYPPRMETSHMRRFLSLSLSSEKDQRETHEETEAKKGILMEETGKETRPHLVSIQ